MNFARVYYSPKDCATQVVAGDLYFVRGKPVLVVTWRRKDGDRVPDECIELDPGKLQRASSNGTIYRYEGKVQTCARSPRAHMEPDGTVSVIKR